MNDKQAKDQGTDELERKCAEEVWGAIGCTDVSASRHEDVAKAAAIIANHVAPLRQELERLIQEKMECAQHVIILSNEIIPLKRFVAAVVHLVDNEDVSNQARDRNIKALVEAWKTGAAERKEPT